MKQIKGQIRKVIDRIDVIWDKKTDTHQLKIKYKWNIYKDKRTKNGKWKFNIKKVKSERLSDKFSSYRLSREIGQKELMSPYIYSTVTEQLQKQ